jgi:membrane protein YdbS with pleckstrin-like domain
MVSPSFWEDYYMLIYTHCWELMNSVGSHGSLSLPFVMKVTVCHFVTDSHEVMTALIVVLPIIVVVEISLQLHQEFLFNKWSFRFSLLDNVGG